MKPLPNKINARNYTVKVKRLKKVIGDYHCKLHGEFDPNKYLIKITKDTPDKEWHSFFHEIIHLACDLMIDENSKGKKTARKLDKDDDCIDDLAAIIHQIVKPYLE